MSKLYKCLILTVIMLMATALVYTSIASAEKEESAHKTEIKASQVHGKKEAVKGVEESHGAEEGVEGEREEGHHEPWFETIPGWQSVFAVLAIIYFASVLNFLPKILTDKSEGGHH